MRREEVEVRSITGKQESTVDRMVSYTVPAKGTTKVSQKAADDLVRRKACEIVSEEEQKNKNATPHVNEVSDTSKDK